MPWHSVASSLVSLNSVITHIFVQITFIISNNSLFSQLTRKNYTPI